MEMKPLLYESECYFAQPDKLLAFLQILRQNVVVLKN